uniref:Mitogen-activated protein kinase kinase kinase 7 n=1 Tax=Ciona intestinalis TaxID=7719 RepID=Q4H2Q7_CIOIN|nr:mitogen-activated protein kinase kinase kinase [Ciona intestinalis]BAE06720.1 mitogen-activated protein kinase kinase kinase [Ciona intestinalis]|eukprot:NP_001071829.1 mitogen-activated protein kinase kinase kinase [Ciona intestinalis]
MAAVTPVIERHPGFIEEIDYNEMELKEVVGKGSFGVVYLAIWRNIQVAVKMIESESERIAFMTELRQLSRVCHPNIIRLYGACRNPVSLVMEFAECGSLYNLLHGPGNQPHYTSGHAMSWCLQCATGVQYLHNMKPKALIHRDLKPPNLLLTNNGTVLKICDFGTACDQHTHMTNNKGSAAWMAPEVFEGCQYSEKCDVFSWGIILWEVLTRRKPFDDLGGPAFRIMWAVHTGARPDLIQGCPQPVESLMTRCWSAKPNERPSMDEIVVAMSDLMQFFPGGNSPLNFPLHDSDSIPSSESSSCYDSSITDSTRESYMGTISDTVRKSVHNIHPTVTNISKVRPPSCSPVLGNPRAQDVAGDARVRSRSHTPDPQKNPDPQALSKVTKCESRRRSSQDLIAEFEQTTITPPRTPIGSRSGSPSPAKQVLKRVRSGNPSPISVVVPPGPSPPLPTPGIPPGPTSPQTTPTNNRPVSYTNHIQSFYDPRHQLSSGSDSQCDSLPRAYITLELHLQPLPPSTSSKESMAIHQQHCMLAEDYLRVQTEIALLKQRGEQLRLGLADDEREKSEDDRLNVEYQQLVAENTSLQKWYDKMKKDLARVRENQHKTRN